MMVWEYEDDEKGLTQPTSQCFQAIWTNSNSSLHSQYTENHQPNILSELEKENICYFRLLKS